MNLKRVLFYVIILVVLITFVKAGCPDGSGGSNDPTGACNWDTIKNWDKVDSSKVPPEHTDKIPPDQVDVTAVQDQSKLTAEQLAYDNNFEKVNNQGGLNQEALDKAVSQASDKNVDSNGMANARVEGEQLHVGSADYLQIDDISGEQVKNVVSGDNVFFAGQANKIATPDFSLENVYGMQKINNSLILDSAGEFKLEGASRLKAGDAVFNNIGQSVIHMDDELRFANVVSAKDNNTFNLANGTLNITADKGDIVSVKKNTTTGKYNVEITSENGTIQDSGGNVACVDVSAGSRYRYVGENFDHFGLYIPSNADNFNLCIRTESEENYQTNCSQCGVMDFYNQNFTLNGNYEYEKRNELDPRLFTDIIKANGNFSGNLSEDAEYINYLYPDIGNVYSGAFEVKFDDMVGFRYYDDTKPYTVKHIHKNTTIKNNILVHQNPDSSLTLFSEKADGFWAGFNRRIY